MKHQKDWPDAEKIASWEAQTRPTKASARMLYRFADMLMAVSGLFLFLAVKLRRLARK